MTKLNDNGKQTKYILKGKFKKSYCNTIRICLVLVNSTYAYSKYNKKYNYNLINLQAMQGWRPVNLCYNNKI